MPHTYRACVRAMNKFSSDSRRKYQNDWHVCLRSYCESVERPSWCSLCIRRIGLEYKFAVYGLTPPTFTRKSPSHLERAAKAIPMSAGLIVYVTLFFHSVVCIIVCISSWYGTSEEHMTCRCWFRPWGWLASRTTGSSLISAEATLGLLTTRSL